MSIRSTLLAIYTYIISTLKRAGYTVKSKLRAITRRAQATLNKIKNIIYNIGSKIKDRGLSAEYSARKITVIYSYKALVVLRDAGKKFGQFAYDSIVYAKNSIIAGIYWIWSGARNIKSFIIGGVLSIGLLVVAFINNIVAASRISGILLRNTVDAIVSGVRSESNVTIRDRFKNTSTQISYTLLKLVFISRGKSYREPLFAGNESRFPQIERWLDQANKDETAEEYMARAIFYGFIVGFVGVLFGGFLGAFVTQYISAPPITQELIPEPILQFFAVNGVFILAVVGAVIIGSISVTLMLTIAVLQVYFLARSTKRQININFDDAITHLYSLSKADAGIQRMIYVMANTRETTGAVALEFRKVVQIIEYENEDVQSALQTQARRTSSDKIRSLFEDLQNISESGVSAEDILRSKFNEVQMNKETRAQQRETTIEFINELMLNIVILPIFLIILFLVQGTVGNVPVNQLYFVAYGAWAVLILLGGIGLWVFQSDDSVSDETIDIDREFYESHAHIEEIPEVLEDDLTTKKRNIPHITDSKFRNIISYLERRDKVVDWIYKIFDVRERPIATLPYSIIGAIIYMIFIVANAGIPSPATFIKNPIEPYLYYVLAPLFIMFIPVIIVHRSKRRRVSRIRDQIPTILDTAINSLQSGESFEESLKKVDTGESDSLINIFTEEKYVQNVLKETWNDIQWKHDREYALRRMANKFKVPRFTKTMKIVTDSSEFASDLISVLEVERDAIEKDNEAKSITRRAGQSTIAFAFIVTVLITGILAALDLQFVGALRDATAGLDASGGQGSSIGFNPDTLGIFRPVFLHTSVNISFAFGVLAGKIYQDSFIDGVKYGLIFIIISFTVYVGAITIL